MNKRILIVDDNSNDRYMLEVLFKGYGYDVTSAENGADALLLARKDPPDVIISDIMMPVMDGFSLCREWKLDEKLKTIPYIFYTSTYTNRKDEKFAMNLGAEMFIKKPQEPDVLVAKLRQVLEENVGKKSVVLEFPLGKEMEFFRDYNKLLFHKLETKMAELKTEKEFLKSIFESLTHPFYVIDVSDHVILMANPAACKNHLTAGSKCFEITHQRKIQCSGEDICPLEEVKATKKPVTVEHVHFDKDGNPRNFEVHGYPIFDKEGKVVQMIEYSLDITERKRSEEALKESENMLNDAQQLAKIGSWSWNVENDVVRWSKELYEMVGQNPQLPPPTYANHASLYTKESWEILNQAVERAVSKGMPYELELDMVRNDGGKFCTNTRGRAIKDETGRVVRLTGMVQDITERKTAELLLEESRKRYQALFEQAGDGIVMHDTNGKILSVNETFAHMHGLSIEEIMQKGLDNLDVEGMKKVPERMPRIIAGETLSFEVEHYHKDGHIFPLLVTANLISTGNERFIISIHQDLTERKRDEMTMRLQGEIMKNMTEGVYLIRLSDGKIVYANPKFENMFGYNPGELIGKEVSIVNAPTEKTPEETKNEIVNILKESGEWHGEVKNITKDGAHFYSYANVSIFDHPEYGRVIVSVHTDITERKQTEERIRISEERFSNLFLEMVSGCSIQEIICDEQGVPIDYITLDVNKSYERILKVHKEDIIGKRASTFLPAEELNEWVKIFGGVALDRHSKHYEQFSPKNNKYFAGVVFSPKRGEFAVSFEDVTERKHIEEELMKVKLGIERSDEVIFITNMDGTIIFVNPAFEKIYGYSKEEALGKTPRILKSGLLPSEAYKPFWDTLLEKKVVKGELVNKTKDGRLLNIDGSANPILNNDGVTVGFLAIQRDITERKQVDDKIKASLEEKEVLLREIHHRVKNNMQIISSLLNLQMGYVNDKNIKNIFSESQNRILSMALVHEKLYQSSDLRNIDFKEYINNLGVNLLQSYNANNIKLNVNVETISLDIDLAVPAGLIINELITNSLKYAFPDGMKGQINIFFRSICENMLELVISDNGIGIPEDLDIRNTKTLGLHLVTSLAEMQLHGTVDLDRTSGTSFQIRFKGIK